MGYKVQNRYAVLSKANTLENVNIKQVIHVHTSKYKYFIEKFGITQMQNLALLNNFIKECDLSKIISSSVNISTAINNFINKI